ncbi:MAG TPA: hypothetical protein VIM11_21440 [Tepidisphaeraceae bacterium]
MLKNLKSDYGKGISKLKTDLNVAVRIGKNDIGKIVSVLNTLSSGSSVAVQRKYQKAIAGLAKDAQGSKLLADATSVNAKTSADLAAIDAAVPADSPSKADVSNSVSVLTTQSSALETHGQALQTAVLKFLSDLLG